MKVIDQKRVIYDSDMEFYQHQAHRSNPHDKNRLVTGRNAELLHFLFCGGQLPHTYPAVMRENPCFATDIRSLDVGCRDGWSLDYVNNGCPKWGINLFTKRKKYLNTTGIELIHETVEYARKKRRNVIELDIRKSMLEGELFDVIYTRHCLEHIDEPLNALRNIAKMLRKGGTLLAVVPKEENFLTLDRGNHSYLFREDNELADMVEQAGLRVTHNIVRKAYWYRKRKYWYKLRAKLRCWGPELCVLATKKV